MQVLYVELGYEQPLADWPQRELGYNHKLKLIADWGTPCEILCGTYCTINGCNKPENFDFYIQKKKDLSFLFRKKMLK